MSAMLPPAPPARWPTALRALRHRNYRLYLFAQAISQTGFWVQMAALTWLAYELTGQSRWPALLSAAHVLPTVVLGAWGGGLADRWPRRAMVFATQSALLLLALALAAMAALRLCPVEALLAVSLLNGAVSALDQPARLALVYDMVTRDDLLNAVALSSVGFNVARAVGPALAGQLLAGPGAAACFLVNAVTFLAVLIALGLMRLPPAAREAPPGEKGGLLSGARHLGARPRLVLLVVLAGAMAFFAWPLLSLLPALADKHLGAGERGYASMLSGLGVGALVGALGVAAFGTAWRRPALLAGGVVLGVAALVGLTRAASLPPAVACCALAGAGMIVFFATGQATMQLGAADHNRGRVMAIWLMVLSAGQPAGNVVFGWLADARGVVEAIEVQAAGIALAGAAVALASRRFAAP